MYWMKVNLILIVILILIYNENFLLISTTLSLQ